MRLWNINGKQVLKDDYFLLIELVLFFQQTLDVEVGLELQIVLMVLDKIFGHVINEEFKQYFDENLWLKRGMFSFACYFIWPDKWACYLIN